MKMLIGGKKLDASNKQVIEVINPATQELLDTVPSATQKDIENALDIAQEGKTIWSETPQRERCNILMKYADLIEKNQQELALLNCKDTGKTIKNAEIEVAKVSLIVRGFAERANHLYGLSIPDSADNDVIFTRREPLGVVVCIIPFNFPASTYAYKVSPALAMGNAVIIKPPTDNPLTDIRMTELLLESGVPGSVAQIVTGRGSLIGKYLISSPKIDAITITGSTTVGIEVATEAAHHLHHVSLELGGNDPMIIFEDADLELALQELSFARISNGGQICIAAKRLIVHNSIKNAFTNLLIAKLKTLRIGNPLDPLTDMGCMINEAAAIEIENQVKFTTQQGAKCLYGGKRFNRTFFEPTVLVDVTPEMDIAKDMEVFGPVMPIIGFDTLEEAVHIANSSIYGLSGGVMTKDMNRAMKVAAMLESGSVVINGSGRYRSPDSAFCGYKMSGLGQEGISCSLEEMSHVKTIVLKGALKK
jgi:succinate-semialdehyde dehydrogenase/glutarate-semialdehyde dehydrogenase